MYINTRQIKVLSEIMQLLAVLYDEREVRVRIGTLLMELLSADSYASYLWDDSQQQFVDRVAISMSDSNLANYEAYYQFNDPITHRLKACAVPTTVTQILPQSDLLKTEFFNDFLSVDGLYWGVNLYVCIDDRGTGDMRLWRSSERYNFDANDLALLRMIMPAFEAALRRCRTIRGAPDTAVPSPAESGLPLSRLTSREQEVARMAATGMPDKEIARHLNISFTTVRTHLDHAFRKLQASNRGQLAARLR